MANTKNDEQYISFDPYAGDESEVQCKRVTIIKTRFPQFCTFCNLYHPAGMQMRCERAKVDGVWQSNYVCLESINKYLLGEK
jgi:hypothetical protein